MKNIYAKSVYSHITNRLPNTLLLIVIGSDAYDEDKYNGLLQRLREDGVGRKGKDLVRVITKQELMSINNSDLQDKVAINA